MPWKAMSLSSRSTSHEEKRRIFILYTRSRNECSDYLSNTDSTDTAKVRHPGWKKHIQLQHPGISYMRHPYIGVSYRLSLFAVRQCLDVQVWQEQTRREYFLLNNLLIERWTLKIWVLQSKSLFWYHPLWKVTRGLRRNKRRSIYSKAGVT